MSEEEKKVRRLAALMGYRVDHVTTEWQPAGSHYLWIPTSPPLMRCWNPYRNKGQAFEVMERLKVSAHDASGEGWEAIAPDGRWLVRPDLATAICDAVLAAHSEE